MLEDLCCALVGWRDDAVVHPLAFAACGDDAGIAEVGEVPGDFRLGLIEDFDEVADADFLIAHEIEEAEASLVGECLEEAFELEGLLFRWHG